MVADQLPDSHPTKKVALEYRDAYQKAHNEPARGAFSGYAFDGWLVLLDSQRRWWTAHRIITDAFATAGRAERSHESIFAGT